MASGCQVDLETALKDAGVQIRIEADPQGSGFGLAGLRHA